MYMSLTLADPVSSNDNTTWKNQHFQLDNGIETARFLSRRSFRSTTAIDPSSHAFLRKRVEGTKRNCKGKHGRHNIISPAYFGCKKPQMHFSANLVTKICMWRARFTGLPTVVITSSRLSLFWVDGKDESVDDGCEPLTSVWRRKVIKPDTTSSCEELAGLNADKNTVVVRAFQSVHFEESVHRTGRTDKLVFVSAGRQMYN